MTADKEPRPGAHEAFVAPLWKQGIGSTIHCCAGDATAIIAAAVIAAMVGLPMWQDMIVEHAAGFLFGLLVFQALSMRKIMVGSYGDDVRRSFVPELISEQRADGRNVRRKERPEVERGDFRQR